MSLYIRVLNNFYTHRKTVRLRAVIGDAAFWVPPRLWAYASENQPDGCFKDYLPEEIALLIGYSGDAKLMLQALLDARYMDADPLRIHDWEEHNSYHSAYAKRAKTAAEARWAKKPEVENSSSVHVPESTVPDLKGGKHCLNDEKRCLKDATSIESAEKPAKAQNPHLEADIEFIHQSFCRDAKKEFRLTADASKLWRKAIREGYTAADLNTVVRHLTHLNRQRPDKRYHVKIDLTLLKDLATFDSRLQEARAWLRNLPTPPTARQEALQTLRPVVGEPAQSFTNVQTAQDIMPEILQGLKP